MIHTATQILKEKFLKQLSCEHNIYVADEFDEGVKSGRYNYAIEAINEARIAVLDEIKAKVVDNRNIAHVACLESEKQTFNLCINIIENAIHQIK